MNREGDLQSPGKEGEGVCDLQLSEACVVGKEADLFL